MMESLTVTPTADRILDLTLEIIHLLTGEDYSLVKTAFLFSNIYPPIATKWQRVAFRTPHRSMEQKILEVTKNIAELLTGEVPIRCQDVAVYLSMEERQYLEEHEELYEAAMMEDGHHFLWPLESEGDGSALALMLEVFGQLKAKGYDGHDAQLQDREARTAAAPLPPSQEINKLEILEVIKKVMERLTGEVLIRCQDVAIYLSMEEWQYLEEHEELYEEAMMEEESKNTKEQNAQRNETSSQNHERSMTAKEQNAEDTADREHRKNMRANDHNAEKLTTDKRRVHKLMTTSEQNAESVMDKKPTDKTSPELQKGKTVRNQNGAMNRSHNGEDKKEQNVLKKHQATCLSADGLADGGGSPSPEVPLCCTECGRSFRFRSKLVRHQAQHAGTSAALPHPCPECEKSFRYNSDLLRHLRRHTGEKPFTCPQCGKGFPHQANLKKHLLTHRQERPYECEQCGKAFAEERSLERHQRLHNGETPFLCSECGKCFPDLAHLTRHHRTHTGERPYVCSRCHRSFAHKSHLNRHLRRHAGHAHLLCPLCGRSFCFKKALLNHQRLHLGASTTPAN